LLNGVLTTGDILSLETAGLELRGTLGQAARLNRSIAHEGTALSSLSFVVMAGVGGSNGGQAYEAGSNGRSKMNHC
jgi:hypothetical protein